MPRHFLDLDQIDKTVLRAMIDEAVRQKLARKTKEPSAKTQEQRLLAGKILALLLIKPSTRTRISFDIAMREMGGETIFLPADTMMLNRNESIADTAKVLARYVDAVMIRAGEHETLCELAQHCDKPVINGLTFHSHPCQLMADILTFEEHKGPIAGKTIAWSGCANNVLVSWIHAAVQFSFALHIACPARLAPQAALLDKARAQGGAITVFQNPYDAVRGADCVVTDTWNSLGDDENLRQQRTQILAPYRVDQKLMQASNGAIFMHCLPAYRGVEVEAEVIDGPDSVIFDEAENRLHTQKGILAWCFDLL